MSRSVQIVAPDLHKLKGLSERLFHWGGEELPSEPRRFQFGVLGMTLLPIPAHIRARLSSALAIQQSALELDEEVVNRWAAGRPLSEFDKDLESLFRCVAALNTWTVIYESGSGTGAEVIECSPARLFQHLDATIRGTDRDLTLLTPLQPAADQ